MTPGWYTDPHDPRQLRWWSGEGWTEHVSAGSGQQQAAEAAAAVPAQVAPAQVTPAADQPLPSRRALRDPATEASEAAEAALAGQAAQQQAQAAAAQQQAAQQQAAQQQATQQAAQQQAWDAQQAAVPPVQPIQPQVVQPEAVQPQFDAPVAAQQPSAPVPTLPVAPTSFLEQQGYAPLDGSAPGAEPAQGGWSQPAAAPAAAAQPNAWDQPVQPVQPVQPIQPQQPVQPVQPNAWSQPVQPDSVQPNAWNQPLQPIQPVQPTQPEQQGWGAPANEGIDSLFGGAPSGQVAAQTPQAGQWGLTPSDGESGGRRQAAEVAEVAGSSTFWAWLIAISPILAAGAVAYVMLTVKPAFTDWQFEAAVAAPYLLVLLFAVADRAALLQLGHSQPRSPGWALLSAPIYLIARAGETRREDGSGTALTLVWFFSVLVAAGGIVGYGFLTHHALIAGLPT